MLLARLVAASDAIGATRSRKQKASLLAEVLTEMAPDDIPIAVGYLIGDMRQGRIGVGHRAVYDIDVDAANTPTLTVRDVDDTLEAVSQVAGPGSQADRREGLSALLAAATDAEQSFLRRLVLRELRQGALVGVMVEALAKAAEVPPDEVRRAAMVRGDLRVVAEAALSGGVDALKQFHLELFRPLQPMLAQSAGDVAAAFEKIRPAILEAKLDGARIQVHKQADRVAAYSRNLRDVTESIPEIVEAVRTFPADTLILDGEAIALKPDGRPERFQVTMSRFGRSVDVGASAASLPLTAFFFDCLHLDGTDLLDRSATERFAALQIAVPPRHLPARLATDDPTAAADFASSVLASGHEGVMVKDPDATYAAGRRGAAWLKVKPAHTLDLVALAVEWGSGRRRGWLSNLHLGARDPDGGFVMLGKTFKGLTDETLRWQTERFLELETHRKGHVVYVRPEQVVEIAFDGIQASTRYPGGMALRFARVKGYRDDKSADEADTVDTVRAIFEG
jgi:DNA ligase-1